jgi:hypothetical protein
VGIGGNDNWLFAETAARDEPPQPHFPQRWMLFVTVMNHTQLGSGFS